MLPGTWGLGDRQKLDTLHVSLADGDTYALTRAAHVKGGVACLRACSRFLLIGACITQIELVVAAATCFPVPALVAAAASRADAWSDCSGVPSVVTHAGSGELPISHLHKLCCPC